MTSRTSEEPARWRLPHRPGDTLSNPKATPAPGTSGAQGGRLAAAASDVASPPDSAAALHQALIHSGVTRRAALAGLMQLPGVDQASIWVPKLQNLPAENPGALRRVNIRHSAVFSDTVTAGCSGVTIRMSHAPIPRRRRGGGSGHPTDGGPRAGPLTFHHYTVCFWEQGQKVRT